MENRMPEAQGTIIAAFMEQLIQTGPEGRGQAFTARFNLAMRLERERHLGAEAYERNAERRGYANRYKPKTRDTAEPFFPQSLERGRRSCRAVMLAIAEMYGQGVSTRDAAKVMAEFGLKSLSSTQVSRAAALLDEELRAWRSRPLDDAAYLLLDARYERSATAAWSATPPSSRPSGSVPTGAAACSASPPPCRRRKSIGAPFSMT